MLKDKYDDKVEFLLGIKQLFIIEMYKITYTNISKNSPIKSQLEIPAVCYECWKRRTKIIYICR